VSFCSDYKDISVYDIYKNETMIDRCGSPLETSKLRIDGRR